MTNAQRLRELAKKCEELATIAWSDDMRKRHTELAASYHRMADREDWLDQQPPLTSKTRSRLPA
jgi:hypothetical protein